MPATAENLRDLHTLHQRAKALRERLASAPKTLAARQAALAARQATLEGARKALKDVRAQLKTRETQVGGMQAKVEDLRVKLNAVKKQAEYDAIRNQIAHDNLAISKYEDEILDGMTKIDDQAASLATLEAEVKKMEADVAALKADIEAKAEGHKAQVKELETAIVEAEGVIPADLREQYRRNVKQRGADAMAAVEGGACTGCFVSVTSQMLNELINAERMVFCQTCGRILYLPDEEVEATRRTGR